MFIKNQGRLVPVFDSPENSPLKPTEQSTPGEPAVASPKMTVTADTRAELDGTAGVADSNQNPANPSTLEQPKSSEEPFLSLNKNTRFSMADHLLDKLNGDAGLAQPSSTNMPSGYLGNFQSMGLGKESETSRSKQLSMAESLLDKLNVGSGVAQPNILPGGESRANFLSNGLGSSNSPPPQERESDTGRSRELSVADQLLNKLNVNSGVAQPNGMPSNMMNMFSALMQPDSQEMQKYRNNFGSDKQFEEMSNEKVGEGRSGGHRLRDDDDDATSRCSIPGCLETKLRHRNPEKYDNPSIPSTEDIIQNVLHSPDFPTVAAQILHNSVIRDDEKHLDRYSDDVMPHDLKEHFSRGNSVESYSREKAREREREEEKQKEKDEEEETEREEEYERKHRRRGKLRHSLTDAPRDAPRGNSAEEMLKHMMEQLPQSSHGMDPLSSSAMPNPASTLAQNGGGMTSFFNPGTGGIDSLVPPPSPQDISNQADALRDQLNVMSMQGGASRSGMQGLDPGQIQFNMQHNLAPGPIGEPSMIDNAQQMGSPGAPPDPPIMKIPTPAGFTGMTSPISDDLQRQMGITNMESMQINPSFGAQNPMLNMLSSSKGTSRHHISGSMENESPFPGTMPPPLGANEGFISNPMSKMDFPEQEQLSAETPDQLLEYAKQKAFRQQIQSTKFDRLGHDTKDSESEMMDSDTDHLPILSRGLPLNSRQLAKDPTQLLDLIHSPFNNIPDGEVGQSRSNVHPELTAPGAPGATSVADLPLGNAPFDLPVKADVPAKSMISDASRYDHSPDVLLEQLRKQRDREMGVGGDFADPVTFSKYKKARYMEDIAKSRGQIPSAVDPSLADFINNGPEDPHAHHGQQMDIQSHSIASSDKRDSRYAYKHNSLNNQISVLPGDIVQYNHGKMSSDPANVINSFFKDNSFKTDSYNEYRNSIPRYRNSIARPENVTTNPDGSINRANVIRTLPHSHVELRINGKKITRSENQRRDKLAGPSNNPNGETIFSKGPVKLELSHAADKSKIVNIITSAPYNVTDDRKRTHIAKAHELH